MIAWSAELTMACSEHHGSCQINLASVRLANLEAFLEAFSDAVGLVAEVAEGSWVTDPLLSRAFESRWHPAWTCLTTLMHLVAVRSSYKHPDDMAGVSECLA